MIRWGFLGAGYVASRAMAPAVHAARGAMLQAVASRDPQRSASLEPRVVLGDYAQLLDAPDVDAVYISLTNTQHHEWVVAALQAGKNVLCEKPLGVSADDVAAMAREAERHDRLLVEAAWVRWHPRLRRLVDIARSGELGAV
ncbi:MAG: Gfo/Idh/MocA family protein, partial [Actinomycetota bacterium]